MSGILTGSSVGISAPSQVTITMTTDSSPTKPIGAGQNITRTSGSTASWNMGDGRTAVITDTWPQSPGFQYAAEGTKTIVVTFPGGVAGVTGIGFVDGRYVPGAGMPDFSAFTDLTTIDLSLNNFGGNITSLAACTNLVTCLYDRTGTTGTLPSFNNCTLLEELWLWENTLSGTLPSFSACTALRILRMFTNSFTGTMPSFTTCTALVEFTAFDSDFSGTMPSFSGCVNLSVFHVGGNAFSGTLPSFAACTKLTEFRTNGNSLTALTTGSFATQKDLATIDISFQSGSIPPSELNKILSDCVTSLGVSGRVVCDLDIRQNSGSISGQGLLDIATLTTAGWTVHFF